MKRIGWFVVDNFPFVMLAIAVVLALLVHRLTGNNLVF